VPSEGWRTSPLERQSITGDSTIYYWSFGAGETVYVGDLTFDHAFFPVKIVSHGRDDAAAAEALRKRGLGVDGPIKFQAFKIGRGYRFGPQQGQGLFSTPQPTDQ